MKREIPRKNYIIVFAIGLLTMLIVLYMAEFYNNNKYSEDKSVISDYLFNINIKELDNYLLENPDVVIYCADNENLENEKFEKKLRKLIIKEDLQKQFVFLDAKEIKENDIQKIQENYLSNKTKNVSLDYYPLILIITDGKIEEVIKLTEQNMDIDYLEEKFMNHEVIE